MRLLSLVLLLASPFASVQSALYAPSVVSCPPFKLLRVSPSFQISPEEQDYIANRNILTSSAVISLLYRLQIPDFDYANFQFQKTPKIAIAISGGGYRSMLTALGALALYDSTTSEKPFESQLSGLLQSSSYIAGISGGSWLLSSLIAQNYQVPLLELPTHWNIDIPLLEGIPNTNFDETKKTLSLPLPLLLDSFGNATAILEYYKELHLTIKSKKSNGFPLSITDYWGAAILGKFLNTTTDQHLLLVTLSSLSGSSSFTNSLQPYPIFLACDSDRKRIYEFNLFEFGTWDLEEPRFIKLKYLGSNVSSTGLASKCVQGYDNLGFITGTSSSIFNSVILYIWKLATSSERKTYNAIKTILILFGFNLDQEKTLSASSDGCYSDYAIISPNPFNNSEDLRLIDGGENGQNVPLQPFMIPEREVDMVVAIDSSNDIWNWPNGTQIKGSIPSVMLGVNPLPRFYHCHAGFKTPLVVYLPNAEYSFKSNTSTFKLTYSDDEAYEMIRNGFNVATNENSTEFSRCFGCAIMKREFDRQKGLIPEFCRKCYTRYCY